MERIAACSGVAGLPELHDVIITSSSCAQVHTGLHIRAVRGRYKLRLQKTGLCLLRHRAGLPGSEVIQM